MPATTHARLFRNGRNQAVRIPREMELPGKEVLIHREGPKLIIEPIDLPEDILEVLTGLTPIDDAFPDLDADLLPLDDIRL
ncbi:MAG: AbrB/MazE/SpoVT family DNA-binding domain-containing protein [Spirochaetota bacterium]